MEMGRRDWAAPAPLLLCQYAASRKTERSWGFVMGGRRLEVRVGAEHQQINIMMRIAP